MVGIIAGKNRNFLYKKFWMLYLFSRTHLFSGIHFRNVLFFREYIFSKIVIRFRKLSHVLDKHILDKVQKLRKCPEMEKVSKIQ
jgi:hypothetical protein